MKFPEPKSLRGAMSPVIRAGWIFGIGIFEYPSGHPRPVLSLCWSITHLFLHLFFAKRGHVPSFVKETAVVNSNYHVSTICSMIFIIASMIIVGKLETITRCEGRISIANKNLKRFGITEDHGMIFKYNVTQLVSAFAQMIGIFAVNFIFFLVKDIMPPISEIAFWTSVYYQLICILIVGCIYCGYIRYIGNRFQHLNACLLLLTSNRRDTKPFLQNSDHQFSMLSTIAFEVHGNLHLARAADQQWTMHVLRETRGIHHVLCTTAKELNQAFGILIITFMGISFYGITSLLYDIYLSYTFSIPAQTNIQLLNLLPVCCWLAFYAVAVYYVIYCSSMVSYEAQYTGEIIQQLVNPDNTNDIHSEINVFLLQLMQNPLQFTAYGFYTLDYTLLRGMVGSVTTYLMIMIQMRSIYDPEPSSRGVTTSMVNCTSQQDISIVVNRSAI